MAELRVTILFAEFHVIWKYHSLSHFLVIFLPPDHYSSFSKCFFSSWFKLFLSILSESAGDDFTVSVDDHRHYAGFAIPWPSHLQGSSSLHPTYPHPWSLHRLSYCSTSKFTISSIWLSDHNLLSFHHHLWWLTLGINLVRLWCPVVWSNTSLDLVIKAFFRCD